MCCAEKQHEFAWPSGGWTASSSCLGAAWTEVPPTERAHDQLTSLTEFRSILGKAKRLIKQRTNFHLMLHQFCIAGVLHYSHSSSIFLDTGHSGLQTRLQKGLVKLSLLGGCPLAIISTGPGSTIRSKTVTMGLETTPIDHRSGDSYRPPGAFLRLWGVCLMGGHSMTDLS